MIEGISVIICCYNSSERISQTLYHLIEQEVSPELPWEVIVVDNNSTDNTAITAFEEWSKYNSQIPFKVVKQFVPGVSNARVMGIKNSKYSYIIICDDDNWLAKDYLQNVLKLFKEDKMIAIIGGRSTGCFEIEPPSWFQNFSISYAIGERRKSSTYIEWVATAGMGIRREVLDRLDECDFKHVLSGRKGKVLSTGDDLELCFAVRAMGYKVYYSTELNFIHYMPQKRLNWKYLQEMTRGQNKAQVVVDIYDNILLMLKENKTISFQNIYKKLIEQKFFLFKKKVKTFRKTLRFFKSLITKKEGDKYYFENVYLFRSLIYLLISKQRIKNDYYKVEKILIRITGIKE